MFDERTRMPPLISHILYAVFGVSGLFYVIHEGTPPEPISLMVLGILFWGIFSGFAFYGIVSLIRDIRKGKTLKGAIREIKHTFRDSIKPRGDV